MLRLSACTEDRALLGSNPSADAGPEADGEFVPHDSPCFSIEVCTTFPPSHILLWDVTR